MTKRMTKRIVLLCLAGAGLLCGLQARAQAQPPAGTGDPASAALRQFYNGAKRNILRGAEKMPEENYSFRPAPEVRTFGELLAHIAGAQYMLCSGIKGEPSPVTPADLEKGSTAKADILPVLQAAFEYCDPAMAALSDDRLGDKVQVFGRERPKSVPATLVVAHSWEHYGNMVTYLRMKGIVPPSSEPPPPPPPPAAQEKPAEPPKPPAEPPAAKKEPAPPKPAEPKQPPPAAPKPPASRGDAAKGGYLHPRLPEVPRGRRQRCRRHRQGPEGRTEAAGLRGSAEDVRRGDDQGHQGGQRQNGQGLRHDRQGHRRRDRLRPHHGQEVVPGAGIEPAT